MLKFARIIVAVLAFALAPLVLAAGPVNINTADAATLTKELKGIGPKKAEAIVAYRQSNGLFKSADGLLEVKGIGKSIIEKNRANIVVK